MKNPILVFFCILMIGNIALWAMTIPKGQQIFEEWKCALCHSVSTVDIKAKITSGESAGPDLVDLADSYETDWIIKFVRGEVTKEGHTHKKPFKGSDEELQAIVDWLLEQKAE